MLKVGLSGNLCSGYDEVAEQFKKIGVPIFDADVVLKFMIHYDEVISKDIRIKFGEGAFKNGFLNEKAFNSIEKINLLLDLVNVQIIKLYEKFRVKHKLAPYTIFKSALLFEKEFDSSMNFTITTFAPADERVLRLRELEGLPFYEAYSLIQNGPDDFIKNNLSTYVIHNYEESAMTLKSQIDRIDKQLREKAGVKTESNFDEDDTLLMFI